MKKIINLGDLSERIYDEKTIKGNANEVSIVLRIEYLLFTDSVNSWVYDSDDRCFYDLDLQDEIQQLFKAKPISHSFEKEVMDYLPSLKSEQVQNYGKAEYDENKMLKWNTERIIRNRKYMENEAFVNRKILSNKMFNENLRKEYDVKYIY